MGWTGRSDGDWLHEIKYDGYRDREKDGAHQRLVPNKKAGGRYAAGLSGATAGPGRFRRFMS
jgi:hypothetical protein